MLEKVYNSYKACGQDEIADFADALFAPILIDPPHGWSSAHHRVAVVGQETGDWNFSPENAAKWGYKWESNESVLSLSDFFLLENSIPLLQQGYRSFDYASHSGIVARSPFWRYFREIKQEFERSSPSTSILFTNVIRCSVDSSSGHTLWNISEDQRIRFLQWQNGLLTRELQEIAPTAIIFLTGPNYDGFLKQEFRDITLQHVEGFDVRVLSRLQSLALACPSYRTYHPGYLNRSVGFTPLKAAIKAIVDYEYG